MRPVSFCKDPKHIEQMYLINMIKIYIKMLPFPAKWLRKLRLQIYYAKISSYVLGHEAH